MHTSTQRDRQAQRHIPGLFASVAGLRQRSWWRALAADVVDLIFPPRCQHCQRVDHHFCPRCRDELAALPIDQQHINAFDTLPVFSSGTHTGILQDALHALKYTAALDLGSLLAARLATLRPVDDAVDAIIPVPMHAARLAQRGYNQAEQLAQALATRTDIPCRADLLARVRATRSQVGLSRAERLANVRDAFEVVAPVAGMRLLLVDDVLTTGATLVGCADVLRAAGAITVTAVTVSAAALVTSLADPAPAGSSASL
ncbi:MAG: ComF family protein [Chloroflexota bacterium]